MGSKQMGLECSNGLYFKLTSCREIKCDATSLIFCSNDVFHIYFVEMYSPINPY